MSSSLYGWLMLAGIVVGVVYWSRLARRDERLLVVYVAALVGAFLGAKALYFLIDGWRLIGSDDIWVQLATGKTILGGLLGGYLAVEIAKRLVRYPGITGDWFAVIVPFGIVLGRMGCLIHGCCLGRECAPAWFTMSDGNGVERWPAVPVEILFNLTAIGVFFMLRGGHLLAGQHFHLYLIGYGAFRMVHEFARNEARLAGPFTGYQIAAAVLMGFGAAAFWFRGRRTRGLPVAKAV